MSKVDKFVSMIHVKKFLKLYLWRNDFGYNSIIRYLFDIFVACL